MVTPFCEMKEFVSVRAGTGVSSSVLPPPVTHGHHHDLVEVLLFVFVGSLFPHQPIRLLRGKLVLGTGSLSKATDFSELQFTASQRGEELQYLQCKMALKATEFPSVWPHRLQLDYVNSLQVSLTKEHITVL